MKSRFRASCWSHRALPICALLASCTNTDRSRPTVRIDGSSTVFPITHAAAEQFQRREPVDVRVEVPVGVSGTHGGFKKFCAGETDISSASRPITRDEAGECASRSIEYVEIPVGFDGLAVVVNPRNDWAKDITTAELAKIWAPEAEGTVVRWSQIREGWPDKELHLYGAGFDSGTYDYFTQAILRREHVSRRDFKSSEDDDELVKAIAADELSLGFFGYAYVYKNSDAVSDLGVDDGDDTNGEGPVRPSQDTVRAGTYQPLSRPLFIYVNRAALSRREVDLFVSYFISRAELFVERVGYVPLPEAVYGLAHDRVIARRAGSVFDGINSPVGLSIHQLLEREQTETPWRRKQP